MSVSPLEQTLTMPAASAPANDATFAPGARVNGRYVVRGFIAAGATSEVYEAEDLLVGTRVALKVLRRAVASSVTAVERLKREIALARRITHRNVCRIYDVGDHEGRPFLTMELLPGETLAARLARGPLSALERDRIAEQLVAALAALHAERIVHRDFKSANVILTRSGDQPCAVVTDFGLARPLDVDGAAELTATGALLGTPAYMAPEQVEGHPATAASDIYSLGVVLFEMATGQLPFRESTALGTATARLTHAAPRASHVSRHVPPAWDEAIAHCLELDPARRPHCVLDVFAPTHHRHAAFLRAGLLIVALAALPRDSSIHARAVSPSALPACPTSATKLAHVWDLPTRMRVAARFWGQAPWVRVTWQSHATQLDALTAQWASAWDTACRADDATRDPLLHGQRLSCLESSLLDLRAFALFFADRSVDARDFAMSSQGGLAWLMPPSACGNELFLRGQVPLPRSEVRAEIDALMIDAYRQRWLVKLATTATTSTIDVDAALARMTALASRSLELGYPTGAAEIDFWHAYVLLWLGREAEARALATRIIELAEQTRDDVHLALAHVLRAGARYGDIDYDAAAADDSLAQATRAATRLGSPPHLVDWIEQARIGHLVRMHRDGLVERSRDVRIRMELGREQMAIWQRVDIMLVRMSTEDPATLLDDARRIITDSERVSGASSLQFGETVRAMSLVFALGGDARTALELAKRAIAIDEPAMPAHLRNDLWEAHTLAAGYAATLGQDTAAIAHIRAAVQGSIDGGTHERAAYAFVARRLRELGLQHAVELVLRLAEHVRGDPDGADELAAIRVAFAVDTGAIVPARGDVMTARALVQHGRPQAAIPLLQRAREHLVATSQWGTPELVEIETSLGIALLDAKQPGAAVSHLDDALWMYTDCCAAASVAAQDARLALARALELSGGDHQRARKLAMLAHAALVRMGPALDAKARAAETWLDAHPP